MCGRLRTASGTLTRCRVSVRIFASIDGLVFRPEYCDLGPRHTLTIAAGAAAGTEFHSIRFRTRDIANRYPA